MSSGLGFKGLGVPKPELIQNDPDLFVHKPFLKDAVDRASRCVGWAQPQNPQKPLDPKPPFRTNLVLSTSFQDERLPEEAPRARKRVSVGKTQGLKL